MKKITSYNRAVQYLNKMFKLINAEFFNAALDMQTITVQLTAEAYGHITVSKVWTNELGLMSHELKCVSRLLKSSCRKCNGATNSGEHFSREEKESGH